jgi:AbiJ N-terminal domain 4
LTVQPFSLRHGKALKERRIRVSMSEALRNRLWMTLQEFNRTVWYQPDPTDNWRDETNVLDQTERKLARLLGKSSLKAKTIQGEEKEGIEAYVKSGFPSCALEVVEQFAAELKAHDVQDAFSFQGEVNDAMLAFSCAWRLSDGRFFQVDSQFLHEELVQKAEDILSKVGFEGAHDEFQQAREYLSEPRPKDAILYAFKSFESAVKTTVDKHNGDISALLLAFREQGFLDDIPEAQAKAICKQVLPSIAILRNELGGHGQGAAVIEVPKAYAVLALHLAGALNQFIVEQHLRKRPTPNAVVATPEKDPFTEGIADDDVPF